MATYKVFKRTAKSSEELAAAKKIIMHRHLTCEQARHMCAEFNLTRTATEHQDGTTYEFTEEN